MGRRVIEQLNMNWLKPTGRKVTNVWLPGWVRRDFHKYLGLESHFQHFEKLGIAKIREISEGEALHIAGVTLRAFRMAQPGLTSFLLRHGQKRALLALDDTRNWRPGPKLSEPDILVIEMGWFEHDTRKKRIVSPEDPIRQEEASFEETLRLIKQIRPRLALLTHIEGLWKRSYNDYLKLEREYDDYHLRVAYDGLRVAF